MNPRWGAFFVVAACAAWFAIGVAVGWTMDQLTILVYRGG